MDANESISIRCIGDADETNLGKFINYLRAMLHIVGLSEKQIPRLFGAQPGPVGPSCELRILIMDHGNPMANGGSVEVLDD